MAGITYASGPGLFTPASMASVLRTFGSRMDVPILVGIDRGLGEARARAINAFLERGIGRRLFSHKVSGRGGAVSMIKVIPARMSGDRYVGTLQAVGFAAIQDQGGRTAAHEILAEKAHYTELSQKHAGRRRGQTFARRAAGSTKAVLAFMSGGQMRFAPRVHHPGGAHPAMPFLEDAVQKAAPRVAREIEREIERLAARLRVA
jgi:hypothetical protein